MSNKPCRFLVCDELKIQTDERRNFIIDSPIFSVAVSFIYKLGSTENDTLYLRAGDQFCVCVCVMSRGAHTPAWVVSLYPKEKCLTRRIIALLVHWAVCFMPSCVVECLFSNLHTLWT